MNGTREHPPGRRAPEPPPAPHKDDDDLAARHPALNAVAGLAGVGSERRAQCVFELEIDLQRMSLYDHPDPGAIQKAVEEAIEGTQFYAGAQRVPYRVTAVRVLVADVLLGIGGD